MGAAAPQTDPGKAALSYTRQKQTEKDCYVGAREASVGRGTPGVGRSLGGTLLGVISE